MTPVVIDASAGVELAADTDRGRALRRLLPEDPDPWVPDLFFGECGSVLRKWDLYMIILPDRVLTAVSALKDWPLHAAQSRGLLLEAWKHRHNMTFADAVYVALADRLNAPILSADEKLANAPTLPVRILHL